MLVWMILTSIYFFGFLFFTRSSDDASSFLAGVNMFSGNPLLSGWSLPPDNFFTGAVLLYGILYILLGFSSYILYIAPAMLWAAAILTCSLLVSKTETKLKFNNYIPIVILLAVPLIWQGHNGQGHNGILSLITNCPEHISSIVFVLLSLLFTHSYLNKGQIYKLIIASSILGWAIVGDPYVVVFGFLPIILVSVFYIIELNNENRKKFFLIALFFLLSFLFGIALPIFINKIGGFHSYNTNTKFISFKHFGHNLSLFFRAILIIFGGYFFGITLKTAIVPLSRLFLVPLGFYVVSNHIINLFKVKNLDSYHFIKYVSSVSFILICGAFCVSANTQDIYSTRYLLPALFFATYLISTSKLLNKKITVLLLLCFVLSFSKNIQNIVSKSLPSTIMDGRSEALAKTLNENKIRLAFGPYWRSSLVTAATDRAITIRPIKMDGSSIGGYKWLSNCHWYNKKLSKFSRKIGLVWGPSAKGYSKSEIISEFGKPIHKLKVRKMIVYVYSDSNPRLKNAFGTNSNSCS